MEESSNNALKNLDKSIKVELDKSKTVKEQAQDLVELAATMKAVEDDSLVSDITGLKKEELKQNAETSLKQEHIKSKESEKKLQEASYGVYEGIADLIGLKKPLPNKMLKVLMFILMPLLICYYSVMGLITGIINVTMDCVNSVVVRFAEFTKPAKKIILFLLVLFLCGSVALIVVHYLKLYNIIQ